MISEVPEAGPQKHLTYDVTGKVKEIKDELGVTKLSFTYDDRGFRLSKKDHETGKVTYYIRDASGSLLSLYDNETGGTIAQKEVPLYGSGKLGIHYPMDGNTSYELSDHLGNVRAVIGREKKNGLADVLTYTDYYPFGSVLRSGGVGYRYGYQGEYSEEDEETGWNSFELRMYDAVIGRWLTVDPKRQYFNSYLSMGNNPIMRIDPDGGNDNDYHVDADGNIVKVDITTDNFDRILQDGIEIHKTAEGTFLQDFTSMFNEVLAGTAVTFSAVSAITNAVSQGNPLVRLKTFNDMVTDGAVFDLKANGMGFNELGEYSIYDGQIFRFDDYGNFNYGVAARSFGLSRFTAQLGAGINQLSKGFKLGYIQSGDIHGFPTIRRTNGVLGGIGSFFDDPRDNMRINQGYSR